MTPAAVCEAAPRLKHFSRRASFPARFVVLENKGAGFLRPCTLDGESAATLIQAVAFLFVFCLANVVFHGWLHPLVSRLCTRAGARVEATKAAAPADA